MLKDAITRQLHPNYGEKRTQIAEFLFGVQVFGHAGPNMHETKLLGFDNVLGLVRPLAFKNTMKYVQQIRKISIQFDEKPANRNF